MDDSTIEADSPPYSKWGKAALFVGYPGQIAWMVLVLLEAPGGFAYAFWALAVLPFTLFALLDIRLLRKQGVEWGAGRVLWVLSLFFPLAPGLYHWRRRRHLRTA